MSDDLLSGGIHFTGLSSGTNFDTMIESIIKVEGIQKRRLEYWKQTWELKIEGFNALNAQMLSLKKTLQGMDTPGEFLKKDVSSTDSDALTATAGAGATKGTHTIDITKLAQNAVKLGSHSVADPATDDITGGAARVFSYTYGTNAANSLNVPAGTTLQGLADIINKDGSNHGVRAEVMKVGEGDHRLKLVGLDLGTTNSITINPETTLPNFDAASFSDTQVAQDAELKVDGISITRTTNTIDDAITGITLNLKDQGNGIKLSVSNDTGKIRENIKEFVDKVNEVRKYIQDLTKFDEDKPKGQQGSLLTGNYGLQIISQRLKEITGSIGAGFEYYDSATQSGDKVSSLSQIGILTDAEPGSATSGLLVIDETKLDEALENDIDSVADIFSSYYEGETSTSDFSYGSSLPGTTKAGKYTVSYDIVGGTVTGATVGGYQANYNATTRELTVVDGPATGMAITVNNLTDGSYSGEIRLKTGKTTELINELSTLTNEENGTLHILEDSYRDIIENIDKKIEREESRLSRKEKELRMRFARLESTMTRYNGVQAQLSGMISSLAQK